MSLKHLNIVAFNVPFPADYGGVIDVYYRLKALSSAGVKIHLHCFQYGRSESSELDELCEEVTYYQRSRSLIHQLSPIPFIVNTRNDKSLLKALLKNNWPILFEGLHSCYYLSHTLLRDRIKIVRSHNIEHHYYGGLAEKANSLTDRLYFKLEAAKLKHFEKVLRHANYIAAISEADRIYLQKKYGNTFLMMPSHPSEEINCKTGKGEYLLYHGDLSTRENVDAARFVLKQLAPKMEAQFIIAGKNPMPMLSKELKNSKNVRLIANPSHNDLQELIANAHINLLPTFQATGFKLKLLNALFNGRFCVGTPQLVEGTGLDEDCIIANDAEDFVIQLNECMTQPFTVEMLTNRKALLESYSNSASIRYLLTII